MKIKTDFLKDKQLFVEALQKNDIVLLQKVPKSDLHNHSTRGGNKRYIENIWNIKINNHQRFDSLDDMQLWYNKTIKPYTNSKKAYWQLIESAFRQANEDGVVLLHMSFGLNSRDKLDYDLITYFRTINKLQKRYAPYTTFIPEVIFDRHQDAKAAEEFFDELLEYKFFGSIDLRGDETIPARSFNKIYEKAGKNGLIKKAHAGEYGGAEAIAEAIDALDLDQIQHGINAYKSKTLMKVLNSRNIQLNICPTSNVMLGLVPNYKTHPIRNLYDNGIKVTVNSDDILIFDQGVSQEFMNLYNAKLFSVEELNEIRLQGLNKSNYA